MRVLMRQVRTRGKHKKWADIVKEVKKTCDTVVKPELITYPERIVASWKAEDRPGFRAWKRVTKKAITVGFYAVGGKGKDIWKWLTEGTGLYGPKHKKYPIVPKKAKVLRFRTGYQPKTRPGAGGQYKGPGIATGEIVHTKKVMHPGIRPRPFPKVISRWYTPKFRRHIENAMRRAIRRK